MAKQVTYAALGGLVVLIVWAAAAFLISIWLVGAVLAALAETFSEVFNA